MAKKLIKVSSDYEDSGIYGSHAMFSLMSAPKDGERYQVMDFNSCRDFINDALRAHHLKRDDGGYTYGENPPIDTEKLRLLVTRGGILRASEGDIKTFKDKLFAAKRVLNFYEKLAGWEKSKITTVSHSTMEKKVWLITGPAGWMSSSHLLSMATLIIRAITKSFAPEKTITTEKQMTAYWKEVLALKKADADFSSYIPKCYQKFPVLMKRYNEIFDLSPKVLFPSAHNGSSWHSCGGIVALCKLESGVAKLDAKLGEVLEKEGLKED